MTLWVLKIFKSAFSPNSFQCMYLQCCMEKLKAHHLLGTHMFQTSTNISWQFNYWSITTDQNSISQGLVISIEPFLGTFLLLFVDIKSDASQTAGNKSKPEQPAENPWSATGKASLWVFNTICKMPRSNGKLEKEKKVILYLGSRCEKQNYANMELTGEMAALREQYMGGGRGEGGGRGGKGGRGGGGEKG